MKNTVNVKKQSGLPVFSIGQLNYLLCQLKKCSADANRNLELDNFFFIRREEFTKNDVLYVMQIISKFVCFTGVANYTLLSWKELVLMVLGMVPKLEVLDEKILCFSLNNSVFQIQAGFFVYPNFAKELTFGITWL